MGQQSSKSNQPPSKLESYISKGQWEDAMFHLKSPEGSAEVNAGGLISYQGKTRLITQPLWTAIFHHAPFDIIKKIYNLRSSSIKESEVVDLLHVALESSNSRTRDERRDYTREEYFELIRYLVEDVCPNSSLLHKANSLPGTNVQRMYTPLGHAVSNPKVSSSIVRYLCFACPDAIDADCTFADENYEYDLSVLALSIGQNEKRDLILQGSDFYKNVTEEMKRSIEKDLVVVPLPNDDTIEKAIRNAANCEEWKVVNDLLALLSCQERCLDVKERMEEGYAKQKQSAEKEEKMRKYAGLVMVEIDILSDLVFSVVPKRRRKRGKQAVAGKKTILS